MMLGDVAAIIIVWLSSATCVLACTSVGQHACANVLTAYPKAVCLDGSPAVYYFHKGSGDGATKYLIFYEGGGFCGSDADCASRAQGYFGTSFNDNIFRDLDQEHPFFSSSQKENPLMWNWNHVFARYCDGAYFAGERPQPKAYNGTKLHFNGKWITEAIFQDLSKTGLRSATDVVLSGCSAGAIRVYAHLDMLRNMLPTQARVVGLPDSGFYLDLPMFTSLKRYVIREQKAVSLLNPDCVKEHTGEEEKCYVGSVVAPFLRTPLFAWQSRYDADQRGCEMTPACANSSACINEYGAMLTSQLNDNLLAMHPSAGAFLDSCDRHCFTGPNLPLDDDTNQNPTQAFAMWYQGSGRKNFGQSATFPCEGCCNRSADKAIPSADVV